jgi:hypothetical protein
MSLSQRDIESGREYRAFVAEQERIEREKVEKPIREAEAALRKSAQALGLKMREIVLTGADPEWVFPEDVNNRRMPKAKAFEFSVAECKKFINSDEWQPWNTQENRDALSAYLTRNGCDVIVSFACYQQAAQRLQSLGLLEIIPEPEPEVIPTEPTPKPTPVPRLNRHEKRLDWRGERLSLFEIERKPADEFRAILRFHPELESEL